MRRYAVAFMLVSSLCASLLAPSLTLAETASAACPDSVLGITAWYRGLTVESNSRCEIKKVGSQDGGISLGVFITKIILNVIQAGLAIAAYVTVFYIMKGGFRYMTSAGSSDGMAGAKKTITHAVIGLVICLLSAIIVNTIAGVL